MDKIVFVNFPYYDVKMHYPIGLLNLVNILNQNENNQIQAELVDFNQLIHQEKLGLEDFRTRRYEKISKIILDKNPKIIGFSTIANSYDITLEIAQYIKIHFPEMIIFFGGPHATVTYKKTLESFPYIDFIALGESENTILDIIKCALSKGDFTELSNVAYRTEANIGEANFNAKPVNLDDLPMLDLSDFEDLNVIDIEVGRGCPFNCYYCSTSIYWDRKFRLKSLDRVTYEIKYYKQRYGIDRFNFLHDLFTLDKKFVLDLCHRLVKERVNITWSCSSRADTIDEEMISAMQKSGCTYIFMGIETGSVRMQEIIRKKLDLKKTFDTLQLINEYNIKVSASFIFGFPEESIDDFKQTIDYIYQIKRTTEASVFINRCEFYPDTSMYIKHKDKVKNFSVGDEYYVLHGVEVSEFVKNEIELFCCFYGLTSYILYPYIDKFINYYINVLKYLFPNTLEKLYEIKGELYGLYTDMYDFLINTDDITLKVSEKKIRLIDYYYELNSNFEKYIDTMEDDDVKKCYSFDMSFFKYKIEKYKIDNKK